MQIRMKIPCKRGGLVTSADNDKVIDEKADKAESTPAKAQKAADASALADNPDTVEVGKTITLTGTANKKDSCDYVHEWKSGDTSVATVTGNGRNATITGKKAGTVTIIHKYCANDNWYHSDWNHYEVEETFTINVTDVRPEGTQRVYIYMKMSQVPDGWEMNSSGWYTIGYVDVPGIPEATDGAYYQSGDTLKAVMTAIDGGKGVTRFTGRNQGGLVVDWASIVWEGTYNGQRYGLHDAGGANDYPESGITWHLDGYLKVKNTADITITGNTATEVYNGKEKEVTGFTVNYPKGVKPEDIEVKYIGKDGVARAAGTDVGTYSMNLDATDFSVTSNKYTVRITHIDDGWLKIDPADELVVTITGNSDSQVYNGEEKSITGFTSDAPNSVSVKLKEGKIAEARGTNVGTYQMGLTADDFVVESDNYANITVKVVDGKLTITPVTDELVVTITGNHDSKVYNKNPQSVTGFTSDEPNGVSVALKDGKIAEATGTNAGEYKMDLKADDFVVESDNYANITVKVVDGYLNITPITDEVKITITGAQRTETYTGEEFVAEGYTSDAESIDKTINVALKEGSTAKVSGKKADTYPMNLTKGDFEVTSKNYSNIVVNVVDGFLKINPADTLTVHVIGNTDSKVYNKNKQSVTGFETDAPDGVSVVLNEGKKAEAIGTNVGDYDMNLKPEHFTATSDDYTKIDVVIEQDGKLTITPITDEVSVTITGAQKTETYTGEEFIAEGYTSDAESIDETINVALKEGSTAKVSGTNAGEYPMGLTEDSFAVTSNNYSNIKIEVKDGWLKINPAHIDDYVTLTPEDAVKTYDGTALLAETATADDKNNNDVKIEYSVDGKDWTDNPADIKATDVADSTTVHVRAGVANAYEGYVERTQKLTINKRQVTVAGYGWDSDQPYTGRAYRTTDVDFYNVVKGQTATIGYSLSGTAIGRYAGIFGDNFKVLSGDKDVTDNYELTTKTPGTLNIVRAATPVTPTNPTNPVNPPAGGGGGAAAPGGPALVAVAGGAVPLANVDANDNNLRTVEDEDTPLSKGPAGYWALLNLIFAIFTVLTSIVLLVLYFKGKKEEEDEYDEYDEYEEEPELKRKGIFRLLSIVPAIASVILFILTEDMSLPMIIVDEWTLWMAIVAVVNVVLAILSKKKLDDDNVDDDGSRVMA